jgi:non-heme chloroperoxidase
MDDGVKLEVLDWGGSGRPLILLAALENTAHVYDTFAPKLTSAYHVYGITRRGHGASGAPAFGYSADRLGDDVLAVIEALKLSGPVLVGNGIAGEELSSVGTRHPEKVAGLIYLEAGYAYAYYDRSRGDLHIDLLDLQKKLEQLRPLVREPPRTKFPAFKKDLIELQNRLEELQAWDNPRTPKWTPLAQKVLQTNLPAVQKELQEVQQNPEILQPGRGRRYPAKVVQDLLQTGFPGFEKDLMHEIQKGVPPASSDPAVPESEVRQHFEIKSDGSMGKPRAYGRADEAILTGLEKFSSVSAPILAVFGPHDADDEVQVSAFEKGLKSAHVVRVPNASRLIFLSNEADVLREMTAFLNTLH